MDIFHMLHIQHGHQITRNVTYFPILLWHIWHICEKGLPI